jgi:hypothetical protein
MPKRRSRAQAPGDVRHEVATEAARLMVEHGIQDFAQAKRKAAERLGVRAAGAVLPSNEQIHAEVREWQRLFEPEADERLAQQRRVAAAVMQLLEPFRPRLVGSVLDGTATVNTAIELHVFSDAPEDVVAVLEGNRLRVRDSQRRYRFGKDVTEHVPGYALNRDGESLEVMVFPERGAGHAPLSPVDGRPMRRASRSAVLALLETQA